MANRRQDRSYRDFGNLATIGRRAADLTYQRGARLITGHDNVTDAISIASKR